MSERWTEDDVQAYYARRGLRTSRAKGEGPQTHYSEAWLLEQVRAVAKRYGWMCYHTHDSRKSEPGFPDVVLVDHTVIFAELKTATGKLTAAQMLWIEMLRHAGAEVHIWRPANMQDIIERLSRHSTRDTEEVPPC